MNEESKRSLDVDGVPISLSLSNHCDVFITILGQNHFIEVQEWRKHHHSVEGLFLSAMKKLMNVEVDLHEVGLNPCRVSARANVRGIPFLGEATEASESDARLIAVIRLFIQSQTHNKPRKHRSFPGL